MKLNLKALCLALACIAGLPMAHAASASPATDALSACLTRSVTADDRLVLVKWVFATMARHPSVSAMATISDAQHTAITRDAGKLFSRLLTDSCASETRQAYVSDGEGAISTAFSALGATAMQDLMTHPDVQASLSELGSYLDMNKLQAVFAAQPPATGN